MQNMNNVVKLTGTIVSGFTFNHEVKGEKFFETEIAVKRSSETEDRIRVLISERLYDITKSLENTRVVVEGQLRTHNRAEGDKNHTEVFVFAKNMEMARTELEMKYDNNKISLVGYLCKPPIYRATPLGRKICDVWLAVNRQYKKSDYIPCIIWGRNAEWLSTMTVGTHISIEGRVQSRQYEKVIGEEKVVRTAYEVSVSGVKKIEAEE